MVETGARRDCDRSDTNGTSRATTHPNSSRDIGNCSTTTSIQRMVHMRKPAGYAYDTHFAKTSSVTHRRSTGYNNAMPALHLMHAHQLAVQYTPCLWYADHTRCLPNTDSQCSDYDPKPIPVENRTRTTCLHHVYLIPKTQPDPRRNLSSTDMTHTDATHTEIARSSRGNHDHEHPDQHFTAKSPFRWFPSSNPGDEPQRNLTEHRHRRKWIWGSRKKVPFKALARACGARGLLSIELQENA